MDPIQDPIHASHAACRLPQRATDDDDDDDADVGRHDVATDVAPNQLACPAHDPPALEVDTVASAGHDHVLQLPPAAANDDEDGNGDDDDAAVAAAR